MALPRFQKDWSRPDDYEANVYKHIRTLGTRSQADIPELDLVLKRRDSSTAYKVLKKHGVYEGTRAIFFPGEFLIHHEMLRHAIQCPQIIRMSDFWITQAGNRACLEFDHCEGGDAYNLMLRARDEEKPLPLSLVLHVMTHLFLAIIYLETGSCFDFASKTFGPDLKGWTPITHRALCPKNIYFRFADKTGDNIPLPEPVLGNFRHAIPAASHYASMVGQYHEQEEIVDGQLQPVFVEDFTFNKRLYIHDEILPPDAGENIPDIERLARIHGTNRTPAQRFATNVYQVGAAICSLATREDWRADDKNLLLANDKEYLRWKLSSAGLSRVMTGILLKITDARPKNRGDVKSLKNLVSTIIKTRDAYFLQETVNGQFRPEFYIFPNMPRAGKRPSFQYHSEERQSRRPTSSSSRSSLRSGSPIREVITNVKNYVRSHSPVRRSSFSSSGSYRRRNSAPFGGDQEPAPRTLY